MSRRPLRPVGAIKQRWSAIRRSRVAFTSVLMVGVITAGGSTAAALGAFERTGTTQSSLAADASTALAARSGSVGSSSGDAAQDGRVSSSPTQSTAATTPATASKSTVAETMSTTTSASAVSATPEPGVAPTTSTTAPALPAPTQTLSLTTAPRRSTTTAASTTTGSTTTATTSLTTTTRTQTSPTTSTRATTTTQTATSTQTARAPVPISLPPGAATAYAPGQTAQPPVGIPGDAIDGNQRTAWTWTLGATDTTAVNAGLLLDLGRAVNLKSLTIVTGTPWMSIAIDGATGLAPSAIADPGWIRLATVKALRPTATVALRHSATPLRHLLIWITRPPPGVNSGRLELNQVTILPRSEAGSGH
ncbi:MAG TPA: hypothetical protein VMF07_17450 [Solirubrobacteraceae bacterium]|nr:hypothetical protein [Solirubrobacteraceae bacterium]